MAIIKNTEGLSTDQLNDELQKGAKFVVFSYTISIIFLSSKRPSDIYFIKSDESSSKYSWKYSLLTLFFGWWGIPFGPIFSIASFYRNFTGGKDITNEVLHQINTHHVESSNSIESK
ncbi:hypothetical protein QX233_21555 [Chryseobacterium gambrini]|jgi:hypothetical protein|uniref:Uncharacterized protein n=3 Tax=Chryseobacterium TaxID=59732 RepID=A0AAJ1R7B4_9FLAO|nr:MULTISPECIES: hypothetical protein [Chryseobacterium]HAO05641.1 hypothetical protein [Chryseobacterium sp.]MBL7882022.1 hypothetical protein [Chryseobacterium gambrini]MCQ4142200.1 hypothetical protein [Chryseobacterium sp. EO14]MCY1660868.1 hypothetical protein [Chryseobacterium sp. SL1]MDN4015043.1 hypothetical protein [Chryseobacterium gambrini]